MAAATVVYFLVAMFVGQDESATMTTLGRFDSAAACQTAETSVTAALSNSKGRAHVFCASSDDLAGLAKAAGGH